MPVAGVTVTERINEDGSKTITTVTIHEDGSQSTQMKTVMINANSNRARRSLSPKLQTSTGAVPTTLKAISAPRTGRSRFPVEHSTNSNNINKKKLPSVFASTAPTIIRSSAMPISSRSISPVPSMFQNVVEEIPTTAAVPRKRATRRKTLSPMPSHNVRKSSTGIPTMFALPNIHMEASEPTIPIRTTPARSLSPKPHKPPPTTTATADAAGVPPSSPPSKVTARPRSRSPVVVPQKQAPPQHGDPRIALHHHDAAAAAKRAQEKIAAAKKKSAHAIPTMFGGKAVRDKTNDRFRKWKDEQQKRRPKSIINNNNQGGDTPVVVERVPKLSALLVMGGREAEEDRKKIALEKLAKWKTNAGGKWQVAKDTWDGISTSEIIEEEVTSDISLEEAMEQFQSDPEKYLAMHFQPAQKEPIEFTFILREGTVGYHPKGVREDEEGEMILCQHLYKRLEPLEDDILPGPFRDQYTDNMTFGGRKLHNSNNKPLLPGRGMGLGDEANMEMMGEFPQPAHVRQGSCVADCWLLSAIACLADFHWAVERLFRKTVDPNVHDSPLDKANQYTVTLWDLKTWKEVDIVVDERLPVRADGTGFLLGARPSKDGKFWVPYLEKAVAMHCGGYDKLNGGQCTDAWPMLTGSRNQFVITENKKTQKYWCGAKYNPTTEQWSDLKNSPQDSPRTLWHVDWPTVGGGGDKELELTEDELFDRMIAWDEHNYLLGAAAGGTSDKHSTDGIVDNHAYSIIDSRKNICGTGIDLLLIRNPWGEGGELRNGQFMRSGPGWSKYPNIKEELNPAIEDNGLCWVTKKEFFQYFPTVYVCTLNITRLKDDNYVNDLEDHFRRGPKTATQTPKTGTQTPKVDKMSPVHVDKSSDPSSPYKIVEISYNGGFAYFQINKKVVKGTSIVEGVREFRAYPDKYLAMQYQSKMVTEAWPVEKHTYTLVYRDGTEGLEPQGLVTKNGKNTMLQNVLR